MSAMAAKIWYLKKCAVFIGPPCTQRCSGVQVRTQLQDQTGFIFWNMSMAVDKDWYQWIYFTVAFVPISTIVSGVVLRVGNSMDEQQTGHYTIATRATME